MAQLYRAVSSQLRQSEKLTLNSNMSSTCLHNMANFYSDNAYNLTNEYHRVWNFGPPTAEIGSGVWAPQQLSTGFASCLRYCSDIAHRRPIKLCTMFDRLLGWYTTFQGQNFAGSKIHFTSKSCVRLYWQRYCTALHQRASAKLCGIVQGMELRNFPITYIRQGGHNVGHRPTF